MQILANYGYENKKTKGLSWINGDVKSLKKYLVYSQNLKIPHMGWNNLSINKKIDILDDITDEDQFYFVHSYFFDIKHNKNIICNTEYGINIPAIINEQNIFGFQQPSNESKDVKSLAHRNLKCMSLHPNGLFKTIIT